MARSTRRCTRRCTQKVLCAMGLIVLIACGGAAGERGNGDPMDGSMRADRQSPFSASHSEADRRLEGTVDLDERRDCIPFENIRSDVVQNAKTSAECRTNACDDGCCRIYEWLICDTSNSFPYNNCVCNGNTRTNSPTHAPTITASPTDSVAPTQSPTERPTSQPTSRPTFAPTAQPTSAPTAQPTSQPTSSPTSAPTSRPTSAPTSSPTHFPTQAPTDMPTDAPTSSPTQSPTPSPTAMPTASAAPTTTAQTITTQSPSGTPVRQSECSADDMKPDAISNSPLYDVRKESFNYTYQLEITAPPSAALMDSLMQTLHAALVREYLTCANDDSFAVWMQSQMHARTAQSDGCASSDLVDCRTVTVEAPLEEVWIATSNSRRRLQQSAFVDGMLDFLRTTMQRGDYNGASDGIRSMRLLDDATASPTAAPTGTDRDGSFDGAQGQDRNVNSNGDDGPSTALIVSLVVAGLAILALIVLSVMRHRSTLPYDSDDDDAITETDTPRLAYDMEQATVSNLQPQKRSASNAAYLEAAERDLIQQITGASPIEGHLALDTDTEDDEPLRVNSRSFGSPSRTRATTPVSRPSPSRARPLQEQDDLRDLQLAQRLSPVGAPVPLDKHQRMSGGLDRVHL